MWELIILMTKLIDVGVGGIVDGSCKMWDDWQRVDGVIYDGKGDWYSKYWCLCILISK